MNRAGYMKILKTTGIFVFWLLVWEILALVVHNSLLVPSIKEIMGSLAEILVLEDFCRILGLSLGRILAGLFFAVMIGLILAILSYLFPIAEAFFSPLFLGIKTIPIASYIVLLLIWNGAEAISTGISFLVALPIVYTNVTEGLKVIDKKYLDMANVFGIKGWNRVWYIYRPQLFSAFISCIKLACGMSIKAGVAAEIIGIPQYSFGEMLYMSKIYLSMDELFAWTIVIVLSALLLEKLLLLILKWLLTVPVPVIENAALLERETCEDKAPGTIIFEGISKGFQEKKVIWNYSLSLESGKVLGIMSPSGSGKSTLFRILLGLEKPDSGSIKVKGRISAVFQDNLLCEEGDVYTNMKMVSSSTKDLNRLAHRLFDESELHKKCSVFSGGMKRRTAILRALSADYDILLLDEPFAALDDEMRKKAASLIKEEAPNKTIILFTHNEEDIKLLNGACHKLEDFIFQNK